MKPASPPGTFEWIKDVGLPIMGFIVGFLVSRFTLTKKDRKDVEQKNYENTEKLIAQHDAAYADYTAALSAYANAPAADIDNFVELATKGDRYFIQLNFLAAAILSDKVDNAVRDQLLVPKTRSAVQRTLPRHYNTLRSIADKHRFPYRGELRRTDYAAIYEVFDTYGSGPAWRDESA